MAKSKKHTLKESRTKHSRKKAKPRRRKSHKTKQKQKKPKLRLHKSYKKRRHKNTKYKIQKGGINPEIKILNGTEYNIDEIKCGLMSETYQFKTQNMLTAKCALYAIQNLLRIDTINAKFMDDVSKKYKEPVGLFMKYYSDETMRLALQLLGFEMVYYIMDETGEITREEDILTKVHEDIKDVYGIILNNKSSLGGGHWFAMTKIDDDSYSLLDSFPSLKNPFSTGLSANQEVFNKEAFDKKIIELLKKKTAFYLVTQLPSDKFMPCDNGQDIIYNDKSSAKATFQGDETCSTSIKSSVEKNITSEKIRLNGKLYNIKQEGYLITIVSE